ncbi:MAG: FadR family transcriptional regulator [Rhodospirillales bacterium]|nr:FadR family transcriptional regulator [Rhodospirillales bacterium]
MSRLAPTLDRLRQLIDTGIGRGSRLPPERELAQRLEISRGTLRRALETLEAEGVIWRHVGQGTFVGLRPAGPDNAAITRVTNPDEVMEARLAIEPHLARLAALHATAEDLARMENCLRKGDAATSIATYEAWDSRLHRAIAEAARNRMLLALFDALNAVRNDKIWGRLKTETLTRPRQEGYSTHHRRLVAAIGHRDTAAAEQIMRTHLEAVRRDLLAPRAAS